ncbi:hypothetical protein MBLL_00772 (plasmid) [Methylobacterium bullatum]|uniref:Transposase IS204/IS1001/IS1096/IS1165 DDE domain-containing protein n=1 Tax=Methylobacterium bullatum TaxID=570505 RepID=A0A679JJJ8_9HYPH|nr:hypothetical protein MBLL_00772 [Methylobacterium bullatum]
MTQGCKNAMEIWRELRDRGFAGTHRQVHRFVAEHRTRPTRRTARKWLVRPSSPAANTIALPSPQQLAWFLTQPVESSPPNATAAITRINQDPEAARFGALAQRFATLVGSCCVDGTPPADPAGELDFWLDAARLSNIPALKTFASGLERDRMAVRAAFTTSWSNGQAEGQISKLKMLKRTMYGRASFLLLRRRVLLKA